VTQWGREGKGRVTRVAQEERQSDTQWHRRKGRDDTVSHREERQR